LIACRVHLNVTILNAAATSVAAGPLACLHIYLAQRRTAAAREQDAPSNLHCGKLGDRESLLL